MALMLSEVYDAFIEAGASEERARAAAVAVASYDDKLHSIERRMDGLANEVRLMRNDVQHLLMEVRIFGGILITIGLGILWKVW